MVTNMYHVHVHVCECVGATKAVLNKVKSDLEATPKGSFTEEEMAAVSQLHCVINICMLEGEYVSQIPSTEA